MDKFISAREARNIPREGSKQELINNINKSIITSASLGDNYACVGAFANEFITAEFVKQIANELTSLGYNVSWESMYFTKHYIQIKIYW